MRKPHLLPTFLLLACAATAGPDPDQAALDRLRGTLSAGTGIRARPAAAAAASVVADPRATELSARLAARRAIPFQPPAAIAPAGPAAVPDRVARQRTALQRLRAAVPAPFEVHLRSENGTLRRARGVLQAPVGTRLAGLSPLDRDTATARTLLSSWREVLGLADPERELSLERTESDGLGGRRLLFHQRWNGVRVWPATLAVHLDGPGRVTQVNGAYNPTPEGLGIRPRLSAADAVLQAQANVPGGLATDHDAPELVVHAPLGAEPRLAWKFGLSAGYTHAWLMFVDALDGRVLARINQVLDANVSGSGKDLEGINRNLNVWLAGGTHYLIDTSKKMYQPGGDPVQKPAGAITIGDARNRKVNELQSSDVVLITSATPTGWTVPDGVSAAYNFSQTYDYFLAEHDRNSLDGTGGNITAIVRVAEYDNASWNGNLKLMLFGNVKPYASALDVVGHELTHGLTESSAGLVYENQSGAMNEAFSDIFGEMVEARVSGQPDWKMGTKLGEVFRDFKQPGSLMIGGLNRPYPSKMSEFIELPNTDNADHGGVHLNSSIINHGFWLLAEGLPGAIGRRDAERIFFRTLTQHLQPQSQFVDARLGALASAEALFGKDSTQAAKTAEAFDAIEVLAAPETPAPPSIPVVQGPDATLFVGVDPFFGDVTMYRKEEALGDGTYGAEFAAGVKAARPAVTGDGTEVLYVSANNDICYTETANPRAGGCLGFPGLVHSVALSPDGNFGAFVFRDAQTGQPDNRISILDFAHNTTSTHELLAPVLDGVPVDAVLYADSMTFSTDSQVLIYDAVSRLRFGSGPAVERWSIYALHLATSKVSIVVPPIEGIDTGNPNMGRAGTRYLVFDAAVEASGNTVVMTLDLFTGDAAQIGVVRGGYGIPCFTGDESAIVYAQSDPQAFGTGFSLVRQALTADRLGTQGAATVWMSDAALGILYRRGTFTGTNAAPTVALTAPTVGTTLAPGTAISLAATAADADGTIARVEFYDGDEKLGEDTSAPFSLTWTSSVTGNHRLIARAIDNLGATRDSAVVAVTVGGTGPGTAPQLGIALPVAGTARITVRGPAGNYVVSRSSDLRQWTDLPGLTVGAAGEGTVEDATGQGGQRAAFYRARRP